MYVEFYTILVWRRYLEIQMAGRAEEKSSLSGSYHIVSHTTPQHHTINSTTYILSDRQVWRMATLLVLS